MMAAEIRRRPNQIGPEAQPGFVKTHTPVLLDSIIPAINPRKGKVYVDGTLGAGGYASAILEAADCIVWGIDRDPDAIRINTELAAYYTGRLKLVSGRFGDMETLLSARGVFKADGVTLDLGVSSIQMDNPNRGFAFSQDGPLDMRMDKSGQSAAELVNFIDEDELADIIYIYGEERMSRHIAKAIVKARKDTPIETTGRLAQIIREVVRSRGSKKKSNYNKIDPATRTFQAIRIKVNDELSELSRGLNAAEQILKPGGKLAVVSFHSLEDRIVKLFLRKRSGSEARVSRHLPEISSIKEPTWTLISKKAIKPSEPEISKNPRARSARLRVAERTKAPSWGLINEENS
jgi:16S rRNA (cytosine1402-N4)-methyltransferase